MKKLKLVLVVTVTLLFLGMGSVSAQEQPTKTVMIRILETHAGVESGLIVTDMDGKTNTTILKKRLTLDVLADNGIIIHKELEKWKQEGYNITHLSTSGDGAFRHTTIILEK